jgi:hypothetical protein
MRFHEFMSRLGVELRLPGLSPDAQGACAVRLDGMTLSFYGDPDEAFTLMCRLGSVDAGDLAAQEALLAGNLFSDGAGGSVLGIDAQWQVYLSQRFQPADLGFPRFLSSVERFADLAACWQQHLAARTLPQFTH